MLPVAKFIEPHVGKLIPFIGVEILFFVLLLPSFTTPCYYSDHCKVRDFACVSSPYDPLSVCERTKTLYALGLSILAYLIGCTFFLGFKYVRNETYSYYYEQS